MKEIAALILIAIVLVLLTMTAPAHDIYIGWENKWGANCCNNQDCQPLAESDERTDGGILSVRVEGQWCPIQPHHYLRKGNVPDGSVSHICVQRPYAPATPACSRILCYQPKPMS